MGQLVLLLVGVVVLGAVVLGVAVLITGADPGLDAAEPDGRAVPLPNHRPLTESDVERLRFDTGMRGYRMGQVDRALRRMAYDIGYKDELIGVLEAEVAALRAGRFEEAEVLRRAREAALAGIREPAGAPTTQAAPAPVPGTGATPTIQAAPGASHAPVPDAATDHSGGPGDGAGVAAGPTGAPGGAEAAAADQPQPAEIEAGADAQPGPGAEVAARTDAEPEDAADTDHDAAPDTDLVGERVPAAPEPQAGAEPLDRAGPLDRAEPLDARSGGR
jgi:DivIVA domain-containing protein